MQVQDTIKRAHIQEKTEELFRGEQKRAKMLPDSQTRSVGEQKQANVRPGT